MDSPFLKALAQARPDPGGGSASAHAAALGLALVEKVVRLEQQRRTEKKTSFSWTDLLRRVRHLAHGLIRLQQEDIQAYFKLVEARRSEDAIILAAALEEAIGCPLRIIQQTQEILLLISQSGSRCQKHLLSDLLVSCELQGGAFRGAHHIAQANLQLMNQSSRRLVWVEDLRHTLNAAEAMLEQVSAELLERQA